MILDTLCLLFGIPFFGGAILDNKIEQIQVKQEREEQDKLCDEWHQMAHGGDSIDIFCAQGKLESQLYKNHSKEAVDKVFEILQPLGLPLEKYREFFTQHIGGTKLCVMVQMAVMGTGYYRSEQFNVYGDELLDLVYTIIEWVYEVELPKHGVIAPGFAILEIPPQNNRDYYSIRVIADCPHQSQTYKRYLRNREKRKKTSSI